MLRHVQWPQIAPQIAAAWYVVFLLCLWDVESMILVVPPGGETLALRVFNLLHYGHNAQVNALCPDAAGAGGCPVAGGRRGAWCVVRFGHRRGPRSTQHAPRARMAAAMILLAGCVAQHAVERGAAAKPALQARAGHRLARSRRGRTQQAALGRRGRAGQPLRGGHDRPRAEVLLERRFPALLADAADRPVASPRAWAATATATSSWWSRTISG